MPVRKLRLPPVMFAAIVSAANLAWAVGFELGESKDQLKLKYEVSLTDHGTGRITVVFTIADQGRLKPLNSVDLVIPSNDGTGHFDLWVPLATEEVDGKLSGRVHLKSELAQRAEIHLRTSSLDGKQEALTWYYHVIPIAEYLKGAETRRTKRPPDNHSPLPRGQDGQGVGPPASETPK
jgi:hypothetical protein